MPNLIERALDFLTSKRMTIAEESMLPTLRPRERVVFSARAYRRQAPARGDVILVRAPDNSARLDVKRIVGLPGEKVALSGTRITIDGAALDEPYLFGWTPAGEGASMEWTLGGDEYIVLSDNRHHPAAVDSRRYGPVKRQHLLAKMVRRF